MENKQKDLYLECSSGISGDMAVAALLDAGADETVLMKALNSIPAKGFTVNISRVNKSGIDCCDFNVIPDKGYENRDHDMEYLFGHEHKENEHVHTNEHDHAHEHTHMHTHTHEHRNLDDVLKIIRGTDITDGARALAEKIFHIIAEAESKAHNTPIDQVHFHEVGAIDSIVDVISIAVCFDSLNIGRVYVPHLCEGTGNIRCQHGVLPIPVPAVMNIAAAYNLAFQIIDEQGEFVTPTGAAFAAAVKTDDELPPEFTVRKIGMGAGKRTYRRASILRAMIIEPKAAARDSIYKLETNIDDSTGEALGFVMERLFSTGALDVSYTPCFMKKNRPGWLLTVICRKEDIEKLEEIIFTQVTTIGIRRIAMERTKLERSEITVQTPYGPASVKVVIINGKKRFYPEYESVAEICRNNKSAFNGIYHQILELCEAQCRQS